MENNKQFNELYHYGRKGMKWGQNIFNQKNKDRVDTGRKMVDEAKNINRSVGNMKSLARTKNLDSMSDSELRERVNRMNLEQQYATLSSSRTSKGQAYVTNTLEVAGSVLAIASSAIGIAVGIKMLKNGVTG